MGTSSSALWSKAFQLSCRLNPVGSQDETLRSGAIPAPIAQALPTVILNSSGQGRTFAYDSAGRLGSVSDGVSGWTAAQTYNPQGERVKRVESSGGVTTTTYLVGKLYDEQGTSHNDYIYLGGQRIAEVRATAETLEVFYLLNDHLGSVNVVTDHTGAFVQRLAWTPYGELRQAEGESFSAAFPFAGARRDPGLGLDDFGARFYDARFGRFLSLDPPVVDPLDLDVQNPYAYAKWNPMSYVDIGGLHHNGKNEWGINLSFLTGGDEAGPKPGGVDAVSVGFRMGDSFQMEVQVSGLPGHIDPSQAALERAPGWDDPMGTFTPVGPPGAAASNIPFYGSGRNFINEAQHGNFGGTLLYGAMFATDFGGVKSALRAGASLASMAFKGAWRWGARTFAGRLTSGAAGAMNLAAHEAAGGHLLARHVGQTGADLAA